MVFTKTQIKEALDLLRYQYPDDPWLWGKKRLWYALLRVTGYDEKLVYVPMRKTRSLYKKKDILEYMNELKHRKT